MKILSLETLPEVKILRPRKFEDHRGFFSETYNYQQLKNLGEELKFVQDNQSLSSDRYTLRGLHFQSPPFAQDKLIRVLRGSVLDVAVDVRKNSKTFGKHAAVKLSASEFNQILVPKGFAHGFLTLEENTEIFYKVTNYYSKEHDLGIAWNDPTLKINWGVTAEEIKISEQDKNFPNFDLLGDYF
jgi:dTDP-4-dehydrorhamnose 3,5-epimerase|tara:strand:- start:170 stop:724 length:555 start_codon:yes stop_codon:yes gene_type:complete